MTINRAAAAMIAAAAFASAAPGQPCSVLMPRPTLHAPDGDTGDRFGSDVAVDGDTALIGAPYAGDSLTGVAYVMTRGPSGEWTHSGRLSPPGAMTGDTVGARVAIRGDLAILAAPRDRQFGLNSGAAHVFRRGPAGEWVYITKLTASDAGGSEGFGQYGVATDGHSIIIASRNDDDFGRQSGSASIFEVRDGAWVQTAQLYDADPRVDEYFGSGVSISGDTAVVGAVYDLTGDPVLMKSGSASIFRRVGGAWSLERKLTASDRIVDQNFGSAVAIDGDTVVIGADRDGLSPRFAGAAYIFRRDGAGNWLEVAKLTAPDGEYQDYLGGSVALDGAAAVVGAYAHADRGAAYVFRADSGGAWSFSAKLSAADGEQRDQFGDAVAISGPTVFVGNWADDDLGSRSGAAYVFDPCPADLACDGFIDFADYLEFFNLFEALDPAADFTGDGVVDLADYLRFLNLYEAGC